MILKGDFVEVSIGLWKGKTKDLDVVVKSLVNDGTQEEKIKLLKEAVIMGQFHHPNILQLYGIINEEKAVSVYKLGIVDSHYGVIFQTMVITEYTDKGTLLDCLKSATPE